MKKVEGLSWILDGPLAYRHTPLLGEEWYKREEERKVNVDFVHSLGLKCNCVGWSYLDLSDPRAGEILEAVEQFCKEHDYRARGVYGMGYEELETEWYELWPDRVQEATVVNHIDVPAQDSGNCKIAEIRAYHEKMPTPKAFWREDLFVPDRFRKACERSGIDDLDFCWLRDSGRYEVEQYFQICGKSCLSRVALTPRLGLKENNRTQEALLPNFGGWAPRLAQLFYNIDFHYPCRCLAEDLPESGIVFIDVPYTLKQPKDVFKILIHKDSAEILQREGVLPARMLHPVPVVDQVPPGYLIVQTSSISRPSEDYLNQMYQGYLERKATPRPARKTSEKEA